MKIRYSFIPLFFFQFMLLIAPLNVSAKTSLHQVNFSAEELKNIQGHFSTIYGHFYIQVRGRHVSTRFDGKYIQLIKKSDGHFYPRYKLLRIFPINLGSMSFSLKKTKSGKIQILMHENKHTQIVAQKFISKPISATWKRRLGNYKAKRLKGNSHIKTLRLALRNGALVTYVNKSDSAYPLVANSDTQLVSPSSGDNHERIVKLSVHNKTIFLEYDKNRLELNKL